MKGIPLLYVFVFLSVTSCAPKHFAAVQATSYNYGMDARKQGEQKDMVSFLKPYADSVNSSMNEVLGMLEAPLTKSWPECSLGNFMTDAYLERAAQKFGKKVDIALMNYGGIRLNSMEPGNLTKRQLFELMPFDNLMVLLELTGKQLQDCMDNIASRGGWPVSGATYTIENNKATKLMIGGMPIVPGNKYIMAVSDYVANGGDDSNVLKGIPQMNIGYLQRDALIEYVQNHKKIGKPEGTRVIKQDN